MALGYAAFDLMYLEHRVQRLERKVETRAWRDTHDPFELHDDRFIKLFRLSPDLATELVEELRPALERQRPYGISVEHQVLAALRFYATGSYQEAVGESYDLALSQPSISRCVRDVTNAINQRLLRRWVKFPMTPNDRYAAKLKFQNAPQPFPGAIGAMDCTYIHILGPSQNEEAFVNHHGDHTLNVQAICDPDFKLLNVNARYPGARNDYFIWSNSAAQRAMRRLYQNGERETWLIGDDGYFVEPWLMTPLKHERVGTPRFRYNEALCKARCVIERCFGVFKAQFRCLSAQRKLMYDPEMAGKIVNACAVLHNMRLENNLHDVEVDPEEVELHRRAHRPNPRDERDDNDQPLTMRAQGIRVQERLIARHYS
ncbi:putative nuclease HARBI1 [Thrips palmi]|uniref:Nuclease HARBI1 n=1 Tax=Thrips palmi TaxID=161013 RepID=A0A6P8ZUB7_THRPL|nr:putative nuclease HARBI1 [Thrips palmi]XP_034248566.1 putative nuclease HARBI1 [Thrips palmi]